MTPSYDRAATAAIETLIKYNINSTPVNPMNIIRQSNGGSRKWIPQCLYPPKRRCSNVRKRFSEKICAHRSGRKEHKDGYVLDGHRQSCRDGRHGDPVPDDVKVHGCTDRRTRTAGCVHLPPSCAGLSGLVSHHSSAAIPCHILPGLRRGQNSPHRTG